MEKTLDFSCFITILLSFLFNVWRHDINGMLGWFVALIWAAKYLSIKKYE